MLGDVAELFWASLCRDIPFTDYASDQTVRAGQAELASIDNARFGGQAFGVKLPHVDQGGYISQFLIKPIPLNGNWMTQRIRCPTPQSNFLTTHDDWLASQNGERTPEATTYLGGSRYIHNGRALAEFVRTDFSYQAFLCAGLILQSWGRSVLNSALPSKNCYSSSAFVRNGWPEIFALLAEASRLALDDAWYWKWRTFRRLRPEELAGRAAYSSENNGFQAVGERISSLTGAKKSLEVFKTRLLSQAYPEGAPLHPSFPGGHAEIAGACVTILKVFTDPAFIIPAPIQASADGLALDAIRGELSLEGELNKLAWNLAFGRTHAGIHYRSDHMSGLILGEEIALKMLAEKAVGSGNRVKLSLRKFDGSQTEVAVLC
ncbi:hypothetical protein [Rhizobium phaseoli]|nr:hypothetical protein [Rhizobium phaseoli]